jgi:hypothetical protein
VVATSRHSRASACWASRRYRAPSSWCRPVVARLGASRCRAAGRRASSRSASAPRTGARPRARAATPWTCAQRRGRASRRKRTGELLRPWCQRVPAAQVR